jgi:predicted RNase H-like HicB family nuclease
MAKTRDEILANAHLLIAAVKGELRLGTKHWDMNGVPLLTAEEILATLIDDMQIQIEPIPSRQGEFKGYAGLLN